MSFEFYGGSWALGALCAGVYFGHTSPWWLLLTPLLIFKFPVMWRWAYPKQSP